jgi:hypothetical protein
VIVPAGQTSATFLITAVDDTKIDGTQTATITAHVTNWIDGTATIAVLDNEAKALSLVGPGSVTEGSTGTATVSIPGTLTTPLTVTLGSDDIRHVTVPATVTIPAGATSVSFVVTAIDNGVTEGTKLVSIVASSPGFSLAWTAMNVFDNDVHHFVVSPVTASQVVGVPFAVTITAKDASNNTITNYAGTPALSAGGDAGMVTFAPGSITGFSGGVWTGNVTISSFATNVVLSVTDGQGHSGASNAFNVGVGPVDHFTWSALGTSQVIGKPFSVTVTALDVANNVVKNFAGPAALTGYTGSAPASQIVITEVNPNTPDEIEFMNVGTGSVDVSGWTIYLYDEDTWPAPKTFVIPSGAVCAAGQIFRLQEYGTSPGTFPLYYYGANINWTSDNISHVAVLLRNTSGTIVDFVCAGAATPSSITSPSTIPTAHWTGATVAGPANLNYDYARIGNSDNNSAADWTTANPGLGTVNPGLIVPFTGLSTPVTISPTVSGAFSNGVWSGNITVTQLATQMKLRASDGLGHVGDSAAFNVAASETADAPLVELPPPASFAAGDSVSLTDGLPAAWKQAHQLTLDPNDPMSGPAGDPDGDGIPNLLEYAFNTDPMSPNANPVTASMQENPRDGARYLTVTYPRRIDADGLTYTLEVSDDLQTWSSAVPLEEVQIAPGTDRTTEFVTLQVMAPSDSAGQKFVRLRVKAQ